MLEPEQTNTLLRKTAGGAGWTIAWRAATRALGFVSTLVLARILTPADFGLVALATSFSSAIDVFAELGVRDALIRSSRSDRDIYDTAFTINLLRGGITAGVIAASAGLFARIFGDPRLHTIVLLMSLTVLLDALENIGIADFRRHLDFHREFQLLIFPRMAQVVVTIVLAVVLANYWALVVGLITCRVLETIASYVMHPFRARLSLRSWRDIAGFSAWTWLLSAARIVKDRSVVLVIGGTLSPADLGVYSVGAEIATMPESELVGPLSRACFAAFAAARREGLSVPDTYLRIVASTSIIAVPAAIGISSVAAPLVLLAFGPKWLAAVAVVQILAAAGALTVLSRITMSLFNAFAYLGPLFWTLSAISVAQLALLFPMVRYDGIHGAAYTVGLATLAQQVILSTLAFRRLAIGPFDLLSRIWRCLLASAGMTLVLVLSGLGWADSASTIVENLRLLVLTCLTGGAAYTLVLLVLWLGSGRPEGPEADMLTLLKSGTARAYSFVGRRTARLHPAPD